MSCEPLTVESVENGRRTIKISLSNGAVIAASIVYLPPQSGEEAFLYAGAPVGQELLAVLDHAAECRRAEKAALALVTRAEQCSRKLKLKLEKKKYSPAAVRAVIDRLNELDLVNDLRYAERWLKARLSRNKGPRTLLCLLRAGGIDRETAKTALASVLTADAEADLLRRCLKKTRPETKTAIRFFLKREGFSSSSIDNYLDSLDDPTPDSP